MERGGGHNTLLITQGRTHAHKNAKPAHDVSLWQQPTAVITRRCEMRLAHYTTRSHTKLSIPRETIHHGRLLWLFSMSPTADNTYFITTTISVLLVLLGTSWSGLIIDDDEEDSCCACAAAFLIHRRNAQNMARHGYVWQMMIKEIFRHFIPNKQNCTVDISVILHCQHIGEKKCTDYIIKKITAW